MERPPFELLESFEELDDQLFPLLRKVQLTYDLYEGLNVHSSLLSCGYSLSFSLAMPSSEQSHLSMFCSGEADSDGLIDKEHISLGLSARSLDI